MSKYAKESNADFFVFKEENTFSDIPMLERFRISELLDKYDRVLYLDSDIIITPHAPNIFEHYPNCEHLYAYVDYRVQRPKIHLNYVKRLFDPKGEIVNVNGQYCASGAILASKKHKKTFEAFSREEYRKTYTNNILWHKKFRQTEHVSIYDMAGRPYEEAYFNYLLHKSKVSVVPLDPRFNWMVCFFPQKRLQAYFIHYVSPTKDIMLRDIEVLRLK